jgi:hypothetical protein
VGRTDGKRPLGRLNGRIILKWILKRWDEEEWTVSMWLRIGTGGGFF